MGVYRIYLERSGTFTFQGRTYHYFYRWYGLTFLIERAVEVPIIWDKVQAYTGRRILELGNCLSHFFPCTHDVLDKYEVAEGVINKDVVDFQAAQPYDLIVSISTLEHVGWDEKPREPRKILAALANLIKHLAPGGELVLTFPLGYNPELDKLLKDNTIRFTDTYFLKRISRTNRWVQARWEQVLDGKYGQPFRSGNVIVIGVIKRHSDGTLKPPATVQDERNPDHCALH